ncbi:MAG: VWA domain-containing protein, partial [Thermoguttaceae bacterium]|nr:VWA domain-containing protein [Thermoguttaceae bacterium]
MRNDYLHVCVLLDASESMNALRDAVRFSLNEFLGGLRYQFGALTLVDLYQFSENCRQTADDLDLNKISWDDLQSALNCEYAGGTALCDSLCFAIDAFGEKLKNLQEHERPQRVIFAVVTDGADNFSREFSLADVWTRIARQSYAYSWEFVYLAKKANDLREHCELTEKTLSRPEETAAAEEAEPIVDASIDEQPTEQPDDDRRADQSAIEARFDAYLERTESEVETIAQIEELVSGSDDALDDEFDDDEPESVEELREEAQRSDDEIEEQGDDAEDEDGDEEIKAVFLPDA